MAHQPYRPFESLEWYREAARNNFRDDAGRSSLARWASGVGMLHTHISLFAVGIVAMLTINLLRSPDNIWADKWSMAWTVLVLIHAVAIGIAWAIQQWNSDAPDEALLMTNSLNGQQSPMFAWSESATQDVDYRVSDNGDTDTPESIEDGSVRPGWMGWNADTTEDGPQEGDRASWKEASAAAWLDRKKPKPDKPEPGSPETPPSA
jgi:hypothetical protein